MNPDQSRFTVYPGGATGRSDEPTPARDSQELWLSLARAHWASLVLVPIERGCAAAELASELAELGSQLRDTPVRVIVAGQMNFASARALAELQPRLHGEAAWPQAIEIEATPVAVSQGPTTASGLVHQAVAMPPIGRAMIAIPPVVEEPLGVMVAQAADAVLLCVRVGTTRIKAARRTIELIGRDRILGAVLVP